MHIVLGILGTIVTILILLNRLAEAGIDLGGLNPFLWQRRRRWRKKLEGNPIYHVDSPMDATALLATATAKMDGDLSSDEKRMLLSAFAEEFEVSKRDAAGLLISSAHLLGDGEALRNNLEKVLQPSLESFTEDQAGSAIGLLNKVCEIDPAENELKRELVEQVEGIFSRRFTKRKWQ